MHNLEQGLSAPTMVGVRPADESSHLKIMDKKLPM